MYRERAKQMMMEELSGEEAEAPSSDPAHFLDGSYFEDPSMNQYWYSPNTIQRIGEDIEEQGGRVAFLSTPSIYFSVSPEVRARSKVFDFDRKWESDPGFVYCKPPTKFQILFII